MMKWCKSLDEDEDEDEDDDEDEEEDEDEDEDEDESLEELCEEHLFVFFSSLRLWYVGSTYLFLRSFLFPC